jgi:GH18 family chitinase
MDVRSLQGFNYDTIHFAFANITKGFDVDISSLKASFQDFVAMKNNGFQRVLSFGGWSFSTDVDSYPIFRESVTDANRATFASNVAAFVKKWDLDGVDFDWEYPGVSAYTPNVPLYCIVTHITLYQSSC